VEYREALGLPGVVAVYRDDNAGGMAQDVAGVLLDVGVVVVVAGEAEYLVFIQRAGGDHDGMDGLRAPRGADHRGTLQGGVVG
jgi:hypothetical protein